MKRTYNKVEVKLGEDTSNAVKMRRIQKKSMFELSKEKLRMSAVIRCKEYMRCISDRALMFLCCKRSGEDPVNESPDMPYIKLT